MAFKPFISSKKSSTKYPTELSQDVHTSLRSAVEQNNYDLAKTLLLAGANPEQTFKITFGQHFLSERALLNNNQELAYLLIAQRPLSLEERRGIIKSAVRIDSYSWVEQVSAGTDEFDQDILSWSLEYAKINVFKWIVGKIRITPEQVQSWYQLAIKFNQPESITIIYGQTQIPADIRCMITIVEAKSVNYRLVQACLDTRMDLPKMDLYLIYHPTLLFYILTHSEYLLDQPWLIEKALSCKYTETVGLSICFAVTYGCSYPTTFPSVGVGEALIIFLHTLRCNGSGVLSTLWSSLSPKSLAKVKGPSHFELGLSNFSVRIKYHLTQTGFDIYPFLMSVDYLRFHQLPTTPENVRLTLIRFYSQIKDERSFKVAFNETILLEQSVEPLTEEFDESKSNWFRKALSQPLLGGPANDRYKNEFQASRKRILRSIEYCSYCHGC